MTPWTSAVRDERGAALPLTFFALVILASLLLALLAVSSQDTTVARNHADAANALAVAEAGWRPRSKR